MSNRYQKLLQQNEEIHNSLLEEISNKSEKAKRSVEKNIKKHVDSLKSANEKYLKELDKKISLKKEEIAKLNKKIAKVTKIAQEINCEKFLEEVKAVKTQAIKIFKSKMSKLEDLKENQNFIYDKEFDKLTRKCNKALNESKKEIKHNYN
ncbi:hypothetical protein NUSPORA_00384 [Nucleospora cyclopteri]